MQVQSSHGAAGQRERTPAGLAIDLGRARSFCFVRVWRPAMKLATLALALLLAGCANQSTTAPGTAGSLAPASQEEEVRLAVQEAVEKGYKVVTEDGQTLYCRKDRKTGSRVQSNLTCLTADQLAAQRRGAIDYVNNIQKGNPQMTN
jgi:hypothetical protein